MSCSLVSSVGTGVERIDFVVEALVHRDTIIARYKNFVHSPPEFGFI